MIKERRAVTVTVEARLYSYRKEMMITRERKRTKRNVFMLMCLLLLAAVLIPGRSVQAASGKKKALKAYSQFLSQSTVRWGQSTRPVTLSKCSFALAYIDKDSVPELILSSNGETSHADGYYQLYTYKKGKVVRMDNLMDGAAYYKKKGVYCSSHSGTGGFEEYYFKISKGKAVYKLYAMDEKPIGFDVNKDGRIGWNYERVTKARSPFYQSSTKKISKKEFQKQLKKLVGKTKKTIVKKYYKNTAVNRKTRLR